MLVVSKVVTVMTLVKSSSRSGNSNSSGSSSSGGGSGSSNSSCSSSGSGSGGGSSSSRRGRYKACPSNYVSYMMTGKQCILYHWWRWTQEAAARRNARAISTTRQS